MLATLIELTNSPTFSEQQCLSVQSVHLNRSKLTVDFQIIDDWTQTVLYQCQLQAHQIAYSATRGIIEAGVGYRTINVYDEHPLLWTYGSSHYFTLQGPTPNLSGLIGDLYLVHEQTCGHWIDFHWVVSSLTKRLNTGQETVIELPTPLIQSYIDVFTKHGLIYLSKESNPTTSLYKVLIVGNEQICPDYMNLYQPYIVAESFTAIVETVNKAPLI